MIRKGIRSSKGVELIKIDENKLKEMYVNNQLSLTYISKILDIDRRTIKNRLQKMNIPIRGREQTQIQIKKRGFGYNKGILKDKTYEEIYGREKGEWMREIRSGLNNVVSKNPMLVRGKNNGRYDNGKSYTYVHSLKYITVNSICEMCGQLSDTKKLRNFGLCVHHIDGDNTHNIIENLMILCNKCHSSLHLNKHFNFDGKRITKEEYYLRVAQSVSDRSTCLRAHAGAIIVKDDIILSTGYNGAPRHEPHCIDANYCKREEYGPSEGKHLCVAAHAEINAIINKSTSVDGSIMYIYFERLDNYKNIYTKPCYECWKIVLNAGIKKTISKNVDKYGESINETIIMPGKFETINILNDEFNE